MCVGGFKKYKIFPDMAIFAKSIANGYAMEAVIGKKELYEFCSRNIYILLRKWIIKLNIPVAAIATINKYIKRDVSTHIINSGNKFKKF